ncbi:MAG TPA: S8 family serine peptidase [Flavisolibacter sp.]|nr:S8 family serine peptidase [Flavisolibacter sp.]
MIQRHLIKNQINGLLLIILFTIISTTSKAQNPTMKDFVVFGNYGVQTGSSVQIVSGNIGSNAFIRSSGTSSFNGDLISKGVINLANSNTVNGNIAAANATSPPLQGTILQIGSNASVSGTINVNGNIVIGGGTIKGPVYTSGTYSGPKPASGSPKGNPTFPILPPLPSVFPPPAANQMKPVTGTQTITPGAFGSMTLQGNNILTFSGTGIYVFSNIKNTGSNTFVFDFQSNPQGVFHIYVTGDVDLNKLAIDLSKSRISNEQSPTAEELAKHVYMQVYGNGSSSTSGTDAWHISNGASGNDQTIWCGTVWAPNGNINSGSGHGKTEIVGSLISGKQVVLQDNVTLEHVGLDDCTTSVNAGPDQTIDCSNTTAVLNGSATGTSVVYNWSKVGGLITDPTNTASITVSSPGTYVLSASTLECTALATDTVIVTGIPCVIPYLPSPGKVDTKIGSELTALYQAGGNFNGDSAKVVFLTNNGKVLIDIIVKAGNYATVKSMLLGSNYGLTDTISNGPNSLIITGFFPISNLLKLNQDPIQSLINFVRPSYPPLANTGLIQSQGVTAMKADNVQNGFHLTGESVKVGVISDSYNTLPNQDVVNGDLPGGPGNLINPNPVEVLMDYPYGPRTDEGRAMLQIVHDVAPKAKLAFRTGFITAGDMAQGIQQLGDLNCNVIVDDVTFITEPFFRPGVIANAIHNASARGIQYVTAAGNFGTKSYEGDFRPAAASAPFGIAGTVHDFGGGDIFQEDSVHGTTDQPGVYTMVLQWDENVYSVGGNSGASSDLDAYALDNLGNLIGFNRVNIQGDPTEVLTFIATRNTTVKIFIVNANTGVTSNIHFKFVFFRGDLKINNHIQGTSTIVGQANAPEAITVGASYYFNTPAFDVANITLSSFSSGGGTIYNGAPSQKPDIVGPNGVNTSVDFHSLDYEGDGIPNFYGTSAAAPHIAGAAALLIEARRKFYNDAFSPTQLKQLLTRTATDMGTPGFDLSSGFGFVQVDSAVKTMANPTPQATGLRLADSSLTPGEQPMDVVITGNFLLPGTKVLLDNDTLQNRILNSSEISATLPEFNGNKTLYLYNPPISALGTDAGLSNGLPITGIIKKNVTVTADNFTIKYGERLPAFTSTILVDGQPTTLTLTDLGLSGLNYTTPATSLSNVGFYFIRPSRTFDSTGVDAELLRHYNIQFVDGRLTIQKMPLLITPVDKTITEGDALGSITYNYQYDASNVADPAGFLTTIQQYHKSFMPDNALAVINGFNSPSSSGQTLSATDLVGMNMMASFQAVKNGRKFQLSGNKLVPATDTLNSLNLFYQVDLGVQAIYNYLQNGSSVSLVSSVQGATSKAVLSLNALKQGIASVLVNGKLVQLVNGSLVQMVNSGTSSLAPIVNRSLVQIVNGSLVQLVNGQPVPVSNTTLVQLVNGKLAQLVNGQFIAVADGQLVQLVNGTLVQMVNGSLQQLVNGSLVQLVNGSLVQLVNGNLVQLVNGIPVPIPNGSLVQLVNGGLVQLVNGALEAIPNGSLQQLVNGTLVQIVNGSLVQIVNSNGLGGTNNHTAVITDEDDINLQNGWLGALFGINMITGLTAGQQTLVPGVFISENFDVTYGTGKVNILAPLPDPCLITHSAYTSFYSTANAGKATSLWMTIRTRLNGELRNKGDYLLYTGGKITFNNISSNPVVTNFIIPSGKIIVDQVSKPVTIFDSLNQIWITKVPAGYCMTDVFISGAIINSSNGFVKGSSPKTILKGSFYSNKTFNHGEWSYALAAYQPKFYYAVISDAGKVLSINGSYKAGTPTPLLKYLVSGGTGTGGSNYTGTFSCSDDFVACAPSSYVNTATIHENEQTLNGNSFNLDTEDETGVRYHLDAYPNPAAQYLVVSFVPGSSGASKVSLIGVNGNTVVTIFDGLAMDAKKYTSRIDISHLSSGVYFLNFENNGRRVVKKVVITR